MEFKYNIIKNLDNIISRSKRGESFDVLCYITFSPYKNGDIASYKENKDKFNNMSNIVKILGEAKLNKELELKYGKNILDSLTSYVSLSEDLFGALIINLNSITSTTEQVEIFCVTCSKLEELVNNGVIQTYMSYNEYKYIDLHSEIATRNGITKHEKFLAEILNVDISNYNLSKIDYILDNKIICWTKFNISVEENKQCDDIITFKQKSASKLHKYLVAYREIKYHKLLNELKEQGMNTKETYSKFQLGHRDKNTNNVYFNIYVDITGNIEVKTYSYSSEFIGYSDELEESSEHISNESEHSDNPDNPKVISLKSMHKSLPVNKELAKKLKTNQTLIKASALNNMTIYDDIVLNYSINDSKQVRLPKVPIILDIDINNMSSIDIKVPKQVKSIGLNEKMFNEEMYKSAISVRRLNHYNLDIKSNNKVRTYVTIRLAHITKVNIETEAEQVVLKFELSSWDTKLELNISDNVKEIIIADRHNGSYSAHEGLIDDIRMKFRDKVVKVKTLK